MPSDEKAQLLLEAVEDRKAEDPVLLDLRGKTLLADFFLICSGTSQPHIRAIAEHVLEVAKERRLPAPRIEGAQVGEWVLLDFGDVILHVMAEEPRQRYKLEQFWTTPHPKGALPPTPGSVSVNGTGDESDEEWEEDEDDMDDAAFFDEADQEVEAIDEEEEDLNGDHAGGEARRQRV
jgi:ribosome-associated protein